MSSSEEYLENLLQSMMNGKVATPSEDDLNNPDRQKSAIAMLSGEEPEQAPITGNSTVGGVASSDGMDNMEAMLAEMVANLDESDEGIAADIEITDDMSEEDETELDLSSLGIEEEGLDDIGLLEEPGLEESDMDAILSDMDINPSLEEPILNESGESVSMLDDSLPDDSLVDDVTLDDSSLGELSLDELMSDELPMEETGMEELTVEAEAEDSSDEFSLDDLSLDDMLLDEIPMEETPMADNDSADASDDSLLDGLDLDDMLLDESAVDELALEESDMDDMSLDELDLDEMLLDSSTTDDTALEGLDMNDISLDDSGLEDLTAEGSVPDEMSLDGLDLDDLSLDDSGMDGLTDDFSLEENGMEDDLAEIHDLLDQTDQSDVDDEMLALLESVSDSTDGGMADEDNNDFAFLQNAGSGGEDTFADDNVGEEDTDSPKEKKKKSRRKKKNKKDSKLQDNLAETDGAEGSESVQKEKKEKKPGAFARFLSFLTETDEEEENADGTATDENTELLEELSAEDKKEKKKKEKKEKKEKKGKKAKKASAEEEGEEGAKAAKKKKPKKEKKEKAVEEDTARESTGKKLSKKKVMPIILFSATILAGILILSSIVPDYLQKRDAQVAYDMGNYDEVFDLLYGKELNEEEEIILHKSTIILQMKRKLTAYQNASKIGSDELATLNTLVQGVVLYFDLLPEAEQYHVENEVTGIYQEVLSALYEQYGISEIDVMDIIASEDDTIYTQKLASIVYGNYFGSDEEDGAEAMEDILPEEQEILDGMPEGSEDMQPEIIGLDVLEGITNGTLNEQVETEGSNNGSDY